MASKEEARKSVERLVEEYRTFAASHDENEVNEERVKLAFIAPLLEALGWSMRTDEVLPEQRTLAGEADFALRAYGPTPQIYVECKPFRESLDGQRMERGRQVPYPAKAIQYAWSMKANWAILTNFKKFRLYYSLVRKPADGLVFPEISFENYVSRFDELWLVSKDAVLSGEIEVYRKKATRNYVDEEFLKDLLESRYLLLSNIRKNNPSLTTDELNESTQRILDRLIFVRSCEDRNIIPAEMLWKHYMHWNEVAIDKNVRTFMMDLKNMFREMDSIYNGKLFEPHICEDIRIDNAVLQDILERLYGDGGRTGYRFDAIPINVLGQAYELYIGSVIKEKAGVIKSLEIIEDYKTRQEHGIYYTPTFVTHFIVSRTLGDLLHRAKTGDDLPKVRLLDQAAGSGSFLIEAFDQLKEAYLVHKKEYEQNSTHAPLEVRLVQPEWVDPSKAILQNNIYGVDLDPQAVEITTLNLELKAVRTKEKTPNITQHIRIGNSIISHTADELLQKFTDEELKKLLGKKWREAWEQKHPFKYHEAFREIMESGGFDVVVGNPPYNNMRDSELKVEQVYCERFQDDIYRGNSDILYYFVKGGLSILRQGGLLGLIVARYFMQSEEGDRIRSHVLTHSKIRYIVDTRNVQVFGRINVLTCIIILEKVDSPIEAKSSHRIKVVNVKGTFKGTLEQLFQHIEEHIERDEMSDEWIDIFKKEQSSLSEQPWTLEPPAVERLLGKIEHGSWQLSSLCDVGVGFDTGLNEAKVDSEKNDENAPTHPVFVLTERQVTELGLEHNLLVRMVKGYQAQRYLILDEDLSMVNTSENTDINDYPRTRTHLSRFRKQLESRHKFKTGVCPWYGIGLRQNEDIVSQRKKILVPKYATGNKFAYDDGIGFYCTSDVYAMSRRADCAVDLRFILAILNSNLMEFYHKKTGKLKREGYYEYFAEQLRRLPIKKIDLERKEEKAVHDKLTALVTRIVDAKKRLLSIENAFAECLALYPSNEARLKTYYEYEGVQPSVLNEFNRKNGTVYAFRVTRDGQSLRVLIAYKPEENQNEENMIVETPAVDLKVKDQKLCAFIFLSLRKFASETRRRKLGDGNILETILTQIQIPAYVTNKRENLTLVHKIMDRFALRTEKTVSRGMTVEQLEETVQTSDDEIEAIVRKLYSVTEDEVNIIESEHVS
jgi:type I restriction-modification system DNA methylase subunit